MLGVFKSQKMENRANSTNRQRPNERNEPQNLSNFAQWGAFLDRKSSSSITTPTAAPLPAQAVAGNKGNTGCDNCADGEGYNDPNYPF